MKPSTVILAAGDFPRKGGAAWTLLVSAKRVVACDSAADAYHRRFRKWPDVIIGDLDSIVPSPSSATGAVTEDPPAASPGEAAAKRSPEVCASRRGRRRCGVTTVRISDQDTNDLEKAMSYCAKRGWKNPVIVGATGKREDHTIGNVFRALDYGLTVVSDFGTFRPVCGRRSFRACKGAGVSVFAPDGMTQMTSRGLVWPLDGVRFENLYCATLNRCAGRTFSVTSDRPVMVYVERTNDEGK